MILDKESRDNYFKKSLLVIFLVFIDQIIKFIIYKFFYIEQKTQIIKGFIYFVPYINTKYTYIFSKSNIQFNYIGILLITFLIVYIIIMFKKYVYLKAHKKSLIRATDFLLSSSICALIDRIFYKGSLDYIYIEYLHIIMDLKDLYDFISMILLLIFMYKNKTLVQRFNIKDFLKFCIKPH